MEEIFRIKRDKERAKDLFDISKDRIDFLETISRDRIYKLIEEYYEVIKELLTAIMYLDGYKTLSHIKLIDYFYENYRDLTSEEIKIVDILRKFRIGIIYYGKKVSEDFLINNENKIKDIIKRLSSLVGKKLTK